MLHKNVSANVDFFDKSGSASCSLARDSGFAPLTKERRCARGRIDPIRAGVRTTDHAGHWVDVEVGWR